MKILMQIIYIIISAAIPSLSAAVLMMKPEARRSITNPSTGRSFGKNDDSLAPTGGYWSVVLRDSASNRTFRKVFRRRLIVGRRVDNQEYTGVLFVDNDTAISRQQFELTVTSEGIIMNNLSASNPTLHNGQVLERPVFIHTGDEITVAGHRYIIETIRREAEYR